MPKSQTNTTKQPHCMEATDKPDVGHWQYPTYSVHKIRLNSLVEQYCVYGIFWYISLFIGVFRKTTWTV